MRFDGQKFEVIETIMKTAFSQMIDMDKFSEKDMENEYFEGMQRNIKYQKLDKMVKELEQKFKEKLGNKSMSQVKLATLQRDKQMMVILTDLRVAKKKLEKVKLAIEDAAKLVEDEERTSHRNRHRKSDSQSVRTCAHDFSRRA